ncbi:MAG: peptidyl-prolyl cis-trans isomerase [bacterium]
MNNELFKAGLKIYAEYIRTDDSASIRKFFSKIKTIGYDSLKKSHEIDQLFTKLEITFGLLMQDIEDSLYSKKKGEYTSPMLTDNGWMIFYVDSIIGIPFASNKEMNKHFNNAKDVIKNRVEDRIAGEYYSKFFKGITVDADINLFNELSFKIEQRVIHLKNLQTEKKGNITLGYVDFLDIINSFPKDKLDSAFIKFAVEPANLKDFLYEAAFEGLNVSLINPNGARAALNSRIRTFIEQELLAREAYKKGYQDSPENKLYLKMWEDNYLAKAYQRQFIKSSIPTDEEALNYFYEKKDKFSSPMKIRLLEIFSKDIEVISFALTELSTGKDFKGLTKKYDRNEKAGILQDTLVSYLKYGKVGEEAIGLEPGQIFGPIENEGGYSIIKLLAKEQSADIVLDSFEKEKDNIKDILFQQNYKNTLDKMTVQFAESQGITVDTKALQSIKLTEIPMLVYRYFGFGGKMLAVPYSSQFFEWYKKWQNKPPNLP